ncbi:MAG: hypothetical protein GEV09_21685 [Pseudonocardiaceae bacterium]|nr:hypothetical protein [Pseudonocardiaceae bacterium]
MGAFGGAAAAGVAAGALVFATGPPPDAEVVATAPPPTDIDPELVLNTEHCVKGAETLGDVGRAVTDSGSVLHDAVIAELDTAESRMGRRVEVPSRRLTATFGKLETTLQDLRHAIEDDDGVRSAIDQTQGLIDTLSDQCDEVILSAGEGYPG